MAGGLLNGRHGFGARLRAQRERRGITLVSIAESTKIKRSSLEALERGDVSQWPRGLFRRAYMRDYACAIGLAPELLVEELERLFPEDGADEDGAAAEPLRLTLADEPDANVTRIGARALRAALEMAVVFALGAVATYSTGAGFWISTGVVALIYYPFVATLTGRAPDPRQLRALFARRRSLMSSTPLQAPEEPARIFVVADQTTSGLPFVPAVVGEEFSQHHASH